MIIMTLCNNIVLVYNCTLIKFFGISPPLVLTTSKNPAGALSGGSCFAFGITHDRPGIQPDVSRSVSSHHELSALNI